MASLKQMGDWVTMQDVARLAGVSAMTVSRAFRSRENVSAETSARIEAAALKLGYVPNLAAGNLSSGRSRIIAVIIPTIRNSNFSKMLQGLGDCLSQHGLHLMLAIARTGAEELAAVKALLGRRPDGIVLTGTDRNRATARLLKEAGLSVVETWDIGSKFLDLGVGFNSYEAACEMTRLLIRKGRRRIGYADFGDDYNVKRFADRKAGVRDTLQAAGLPADLVVSAPEAAGVAGGRMALEELSAREPELDAILCATDIFAVGAIFECLRRGWNVPARLAVAGFGDYAIASEIPPGLTTVRTRAYEIGATAAKLLIERFNSDRRDRVTIDIGFDIVERGSV
jgi:LacI family transcriptional regulator, gluconate utilization system Gnt-I transcriptional repressor